MERRDAAPARIKRQALVWAALAGLLFSVGEGLRLTPLPFKSFAASEPVGEPAGVRPSRQARLNKLNPLDVPAQTQKRGRRTSPELGCPPAARARETPPLVAEPAVARRSVNPPATHDGPPPAGRAPPPAA